MEQKRQRLAEADLTESLEMDLEANREPLENMTAFRYLERVLTAEYDYWIAVVGNLGKARKSCGQLSRILSREGGGSKSVGKFL